MTEKPRRERAGDWAPGLPVVAIVVVLAFLVDGTLGLAALGIAALAVVAVVV